MTRPSEQKAEGRDEASSGFVASDTIYRLDEVKSRMGWGDTAFRSARRRGLRVHRVGKRGYVTGADLMAFVTQRQATR